MGPQIKRAISGNLEDMEAAEEEEDEEEGRDVPDSDEPSHRVRITVSWGTDTVINAAWQSVFNKYIIEIFY